MYVLRHNEWLTNEEIQIDSLHCSIYLRNFSGLLFVTLFYAFLPTCWLYGTPACLSTFFIPALETLLQTIDTPLLYVVLNT